MFDNDESTAHLRNAPTRSTEDLVAAEPDSYRQEAEIKAGGARIHIKKHRRPKTQSVRHGLVIASDPSVSVRSSNMPQGANPDAYRYARPQSFLDGGVGDADTLPGMCGISPTAIGGAVVAAVVAWMLLKGK